MAQKYYFYPLLVKLSTCGSFKVHLKWPNAAKLRVKRKIRDILTRSGALRFLLRYAKPFKRFENEQLIRLFTWRG